MKRLLLSYSLFLLSIAGMASPPGEGLQFTKANYSQTQAGSVFSSFIAHRQATGTALRWGIADPDVAGFDIERSYDGQFYETISAQACNGASVYQFKDNSAFPGYIHYRIKAYMQDGSTVYSDVAIVRIVVRRG